VHESVGEVQPAIDSPVRCRHSITPVSLPSGVVGIRRSLGYVVEEPLPACYLIREEVRGP